MKRIIFCLLLLNAGSSQIFGQYWEPLGGGLNDKYVHLITALVDDTIHNLLWVGGTFDTIGGMPANNLVVWDGQQWIPLHKQPEAISALTMKEDTLIYASGLASNYEVGMYVDTTFIGTLGNLFTPNCLYVYHDTILAGGEFSGGIKYWDGSNWKIFQGGVDGSFYEVDAIGEYNGELIVGGHFTDAGGVAANDIAAWNGSEWHALGDGITSDNSYVYAIQEYNGELYVGGDFGEAGYIYTGSIAKWNGSTWDVVYLSPDGYSCGQFYDFYTDSNYLYAAGTMYSDLQCIGDRAAMFDGASWYNLHLATGGYAFAIATFNNEIIAGGNIAEGVNSDTINYVAHFLGYPSNIQEPTKETQTVLFLYPNPATHSVSFTLKAWNESGKGGMIVRDLYGIKRVEEQIEIDNDVSYTLPLPPGLPDGIYLLEVSGEQQRISGSFIKQH